MLKKFLYSINFIKFRKITFSFSIILSVIAILLIYYKGINLNIDFTGGVNIELKNNNYDITKIRNILEEHNFVGSSVTLFNQENISIKIGSNNANLNDIVLNLKSILSDNISKNIEYLQVEVIGAQVGSDLISSSIMALILSFLGIMIYIWIRFEWQFGLGVLVSLLHDALICLGFISLFQIEFNISSIAAILTVIGYSVNDSVVIYDRIRENIRIIRSQKLSVIINNSLHQTLSRTTLTVFTTVLANLAIVLFGGATIFPFAILVLFGFIFGTYSSIFISAPFLLLFIKEDKYITKTTL
ncbi:MAG: protein translocase subunit SecF [Rickettsiales bacterium]